MSDLPARARPVYDEAMKERAFLLWMWECDSSVPKLHAALLAQEAADARLEGRDPRPVPDRDTLHRWAKHDDWPAMRHHILVNDDTAGALHNQVIGKLILLLDKASSVHTDILDLPLTEPLVSKDGEIIGEKPSSALPTIYKAIEGTYTVAKLIGRVDDPEPKLRARRLARATTGDDPQTIVERQRQRMADRKKPKRGKT